MKGSLVIAIFIILAIFSIFGLLWIINNQNSEDNNTKDRNYESEQTLNFSEVNEDNKDEVIDSESKEIDKAISDLNADQDFEDFETLEW